MDITPPTISRAGPTSGAPEIIRLAYGDCRGEPYRVLRFVVAVPAVDFADTLAQIGPYNGFHPGAVLTALRPHLGLFAELFVGREGSPVIYALPDPLEPEDAARAFCRALRAAGAVEVGAVSRMAGRGTGDLHVDGEPPWWSARLTALRAWWD